MSWTGLLTSLSSLALYGGLFWLLRSRPWRHGGWLTSWPAHPTFRNAWLLWLGFLALLTPLVYQLDDMQVWTGAIQNLLNGQPLPEGYVYLPFYAQLQAALAWPLRLLGLDNRLALVFLVHWVNLAGYAGCAYLLATLATREELAESAAGLAPLGIVMAPVTVFYLFFGTNHVLMAFGLLAALLALRRGQAFWAGVWMGAACYKLLLVPTAIVLAWVAWKRLGRPAALRFLLGGAAFLLPNLLYYAADPAALARILASQGNIGGHAAQMDWFHFLYIFSRVIPGFEAIYLDGRIWLGLVMLTAGVSGWLFARGRVNVLQALALSYAGVALFSPEPFRLEPLIALIWLDAVVRKDSATQTALGFTLLVHAAAWFDLAYFRLFTPDPQAPWWLWGGRGFILGEALIFTLVVMLRPRNRGESLFDLRLTAADKGADS